MPARTTQRPATTYIAANLIFELLSGCPRSRIRTYKSLTISCQHENPLNTRRPVTTRRAEVAEYEAVVAGAVNDFDELLELGISEVHQQTSSQMIKARSSSLAFIVAEDILVETLPVAHW